MRDLYDILMTDLTNVSTDIVPTMGSDVAAVLISVFAIAVGFVAYKLIKRALNKA